MPRATSRPSRKREGEQYSQTGEHAWQPNAGGQPILQSSKFMHIGLLPSDLFARVGLSDPATTPAATETTRLAVLIDADNASASVVRELLEEVAKYGTATVKRAYGDWTTQNLVGWKEHLHRHAIQPMQQFAYIKGKNSTDSAFIIDAMDLLYAGNVDGFCLVSSDSDFTRLATRMREAGKVVYGLGERKTAEAVIAACDRFIFFEVLKRPSEAALPVQVAGVPELKELITHAIKETLRDSGWASLSAVGSFINKNNTSFDPRNYGFAKLSELVRKQAYLEVKETTDGSGNVHLSVRTR